ncbi:hypothetical protein [Nigerium massiliense]|uniref:hypothetical protein n=1 Tax=Nigerium massiliense TaxID=1522317 RepID=UPI00058EA74C|nr:hypothetical protein [Nigerium massiliense]
MTRLVLLAGPSGSGKSRLARQVDALVVRLDDFYRDQDVPGLPRVHGVIDWDDIATWDAAGALAALRAVLDDGVADVPVYDITASRRTGTHRLALDGRTLVIAEGIFAIELLPLARAAGLPVEGYYLDRPRTLVAALRLRRDLHQHRKPVRVLLRRGAALWRAQPALWRRAMAAGFVPGTLRAIVARLRSDT